MIRNLERMGAVLLVILATLTVTPAEGAGSELVAVARDQRLAAVGRLPSGLTVLQVLPDVLVARTTGAGLAEARRLGLQVLRLAPWYEGVEYLLVAAGDDDARSLAAVGHTAHVTEGVVLFWRADNHPSRGVIPDRLPVKRLPRREVSFSVGQDKTPAELPLEGLTHNPLIAGMVADVTTANLAGYVQDLQDFTTRDATTNGCRLAGDYLYDYFQDLGLTVEFETFSFYGFSTRNVVATIPGRRQPDRVIIICAHYDSINSSSYGDAPGADDNASGTGAVMEAARILRRHPLECTVRFACFSAEEWGLFGSEHHAAAAADAGDDILAVINLDMVAYADYAPEDLNIVCNQQSIWLGELFEAAADAYTSLTVRRMINPFLVYSDHSPFWDNGYSAVLGIEDTVISYPWYHTQYDTIDKLDMDFYTHSARTALAVVAELAVPVAVSPGDVDWSGVVDSLDLLLLSAVVVENLAIQPGDMFQADVNGDGRVNAVDLLELRLLVTQAVP
jgi:hypothetical protein